MTVKEIFKGYIETNGKIPKHSFKDNTKLLEIEEVEGLSEYAGVLSADSVLVDVDESKQAETLQKILDDKGVRYYGIETSRGKHFYFQNSGRITNCLTHVKVAIGLTADFKVGVKACIGVLKFNGIKRKRIDHLTDIDVIDEIPFWLIPVNSNIELFALCEGDSRNNALLCQQFPLVRAGLTRNESVETLRIINDYVFSESLSKREFDTVTRDNVFPKDVFFDGKGRFNHEQFGDFIIANYSIKKNQGGLFLYDGKKYVNNLSNGNMIKTIVCNKLPCLKKSQRDEVYSYVKDKLSNETLAVDCRYICFKNGLLNIETMQMSKHSPDYFILNMIPHDYNPYAFSQDMDDALNDWCCNDMQIRAVLEEAIGICLSSSTATQKMFVIIGDKANGKSTFFNVLKLAIGNENVSALDLNEIGERFSVISLLGKLANIGDDISDKPLDSDCISRIKRIVTGDTIKGEYKGENVVFFNPYTTLFFSTNQMPSIKDDTGAFARRLVVIPFSHSFMNASERKIDFQKNISDEKSIEYLIALGVNGLNRIISNNGEVSESEKCTLIFEQTISHLDTVRSFIHDTEIESLFRDSVKEVYKAYKTYCSNADCIPLPYQNFRDAICEILNCSTAPRKMPDGKSVRCFVRKRGQK